MKKMAERYFLAASLALSVGSFAVARNMDWNPEVAIVIASILILFATAVMERRQPYRLDWAIPRDDLRTDAISAALLFGVVDPLMKWGLPVLLLALFGQHTGEAGAGFWPEEWPFAAQVLLAALLAEFTAYWSHRLHHRLPAL